MRTRGRTRWLIVAVAAALAVVTAPSAGYGVPRDNTARSWAVRPAGADGKPDTRTHFTYTLADGQRQVSDKAVVANLGKAPLTLTVYGADAFTNSTGAFDLRASAGPRNDVGAWLKPDNPTLTIPPASTAVVPFTLTIPASATPGDHAGGLVVSLTTPGTSGGQQVNIETRVAVRVYVRVPGDLQPQLAVGSVAASYRGVNSPFGKGTVTATYTVTNPGNVRLQAHPTVTVTDAFGDVLGSAKPADLPEVLPGQTATFTTTLARVFPAGPLTVKVSLTPFADAQQPVKSVPVVSGNGYLWAIPWSLLAVLVVVVVLLVALWLFRRRRLLSRLDQAMRAAREETLREVNVSVGAGKGRRGGGK
jgi:hypothetical protein